MRACLAPAGPHQRIPGGGNGVPFYLHMDASSRGKSIRRRKLTNSDVTGIGRRELELVSGASNRVARRASCRAFRLGDGSHEKSNE